MFAAKKLDFVQALRAAAVLMVVYYHWLGGDPFMQYGYIGVDLFFVLSGYIMVAATRDSDGSPRYALNFVARRFFRVWPTYFVLSALVFAFEIIPGRTAEQFAKSILLVPLWTDQPTIPPGWSLPFEGLFYLIFAISMLAGRWRWVALLGGMALMVNGVLLVTGRAFDLNLIMPSYLALITQYALWSFAFGVLVRLVGQTGGRLPRVAAFCGLLVVTVGFAAYLNHEPPQHGVVVGLFFAAALLLLELANNARPIRVPRPIVYLGDISYSLYLVHLPVKHIVISALFPFVSDASELWWLFCAYLAGSIALAILSRYALEIWLSDALRKVLLHRPSRLLISSPQIHR